MIEHSDIANYDKAALFGTGLDEGSMPPNPSPPLCALQQMILKSSSRCNGQHYMLTALSVEEFSTSTLFLKDQGPRPKLCLPCDRWTYNK
jgi:hypothetical protein